MSDYESPDNHSDHQDDNSAPIQDSSLLSQRNTHASALAALRKQAGTKVPKFHKWERIRMCQGELMNLEAKIVKVNSVSLSVRAINADYTDLIEVNPSDCVKLWEEGEYVRVAEGSDAGKEGVIVSVEENIATLMSNGLQNVIQVFVNDLVSCDEPGKRGTKSHPLNRYQHIVKDGNKRSELLGKKCVVISGPWKGYQGIVKGGNKRIVRLELTSQCRIISLKRELVLPMTEIGHNTQLAEGNDTNNPLDAGIKTELSDPIVSMI